MEPLSKLEDRRTLSIVVLVVVAITVMGSFGFASVSENPLTPDMNVTIADAPDEFRNESGHVDAVHIDHSGGESVEVNELEVILGTRASDHRHNRSSNWSVEQGSFRYHLELNGRQIDDGSVYGQGDRLTIKKTSGTYQSTYDFRVRIRLFHRASAQTLGSEVVTIE